MNLIKLSYSFFMRIQRNVLHCMGLKKKFYVQYNKIAQKKMLLQRYRNFQMSLILLQCCINIFLVAEGDF